MLNVYILPGLIAFGVAVLLGPAMIPLLHKLKFGQQVRDDGPESHLKKSGTPTMGGVIFLLGIALAGGLYAFEYPLIRPVLLVTIGFALIGFLDDFIKIVKKRSMGLHAWQKLVLQALVTGGFCFYMMQQGPEATGMIVPFSHGLVINIGYWYIPLMFFVVLGTVNGANFTDGLDGLAASVTSIIAMALLVAAGMMMQGVAPAASAVIGGLLGFLLYNVNPAKVFMGDTGSLALGGFVAAMAYVLRMPLFLPILALIYLVEVLSVIIQVVSFKTTGKRVFKMAPIHHHFELMGWKETKVVGIFDIVAVVLAAIALLGLN